MRAVTLAYWSPYDLRPPSPVVRPAPYGSSYPACMRPALSRGSRLGSAAYHQPAEASVLKLSAWRMT
jgi:hypothetical protein